MSGMVAYIFIANRDRQICEYKAINMTHKNLLAFDFRQVIWCLNVNAWDNVGCQS